MTLCCLTLILVLLFPTVLAQPFSPITVSSVPSLPSLSIASDTSTSLSLARSSWLGVFLPFTAQCTPSPSCCCSSARPLTITSDLSNALSLDLSGTSDGGAGCFYQSTLGGVLSLSSPLIASASFPSLALNVTATLSSDLQTLEITSSRTTCAVDFRRSPATPAPSTTSSSLGSSGPAWSPPSFVYTTTAPSSGAPSSSAVAYQSRLMAMASSPGVPAGQHAYVAAFAVPQSTPISSVYLHTASTSNPSTSSVLMALQSTSSLQFLDVSQPLYVYVYSPLLLSDADVLTLAFSYVYAGQTQFTSFSTFMYNSTLPPPSATSTATSAPSSSSSPSLFLGQYLTSTLCTPSVNCCCGEGVISVQPALGSSPSSLLVAGALDGGFGCHGQTQLSGQFTQQANPLQLSSNFTAEGLSLGFDLFLSGLPQSALPSSFASLSTTQLQQYYSLLTISNSLQSCPTTAIRVLSSSSTSAASTLQLPFVGTFTFIPQLCVSSSSCCCAVGDVSIAASSANSSLLVFAGQLDGGSACLGQSSLSEDFLVTSLTSASFSMPPVTLTATMGHEARGVVGVDGNNGITVSNNLNPLCVSYAYRTSLSPSTSTSSIPSPFVTPAELQSLVGDYVSDGSCVPSPQCCCTDGTTTVSAVGSASLVVSTVLDGALLSCFNQDGPVSFNFSVLNSTYATAQYQGVAFSASWQQPDASVTIANSLHPACPTRLVKVQGSNDAVERGQKRAAAMVTAAAVASTWMLLG